MKSILKRGVVAAMVLSMGAAPLAAHASNDDSNGWERHSHNERGGSGDRMDGFGEDGSGRHGHGHKNHGDKEGKEHRGGEHRGERGGDENRGSGEHHHGDREGGSIPPDRGTNEP